MKTEFYNGIRNKILAAVPSITHVRLYNNQFEHSNKDETTGNDEQAFPYPCIFIEFADIAFTQLTKGLQDFTGTVRIYIGFESYKFEDTDVLDLKQTVFAALQGFQVSPTSKSYGRLLRSIETTDTDHNNIYIYIQEYIFSGRDCDADANSGDQFTTPPTTLELNTDLDIDNIIIRTGDGQ